jgi:hypothetical protein
VLTEPLFERLLVVRPAEPKLALVAADALLRTRAFPLLLLDLGGHARALPAAALTRLVREAQLARTAVVLLSQVPLLGARAGLRLEVRSAEPVEVPSTELVEVRLTRNRLGAPGGKALVSLEAPSESVPSPEAEGRRCSSQQIGGVS